MPSDISDFITVEDVDLELFVCTEILKLNSLHYGYFEAERPKTLDDVRAAQARYTERLLACIPAGVRTVLDVGCGIGDNVRAMSRRGYAVTAISPDANHGRYVAGNGVAFTRTRFEDFQSPQRFDLVLMSESQNYFDAPVAFAQCRRLLNEGGHLLVCGMFRKAATEAFKYVRNLEHDFLRAAGAAGMDLVVRHDITENTVPTLEFAHKAHGDYVAPAVALAERYLRHAAPWKVRLLKLFFRKQLGDARTIYRYYSEFFTPELFRRHVSYLTLLFKLR